MRVSKEEMSKSHQRILSGAAKLIRERGVEGTSVADVMSEAGLTQGGFYRHFETKDALLEEALSAAFEDSAAPLESRLQQQKAAVAVSWYRDNYLSDGHLQNAGIGCPVAAIGADIARGAGKLKKSFGVGVNRIISALAAGMRGSVEERRTSATREFAMLVGAIVIARASDPETARDVLSACRSAK